MARRETVNLVTRVRFPLVTPIGPNGQILQMDMAQTDVSHGDESRTEQRFRPTWSKATIATSEGACNPRQSFMADPSRVSTRVPRPVKHSGSAPVLYSGGRRSIRLLGTISVWQVQRAVD